MSKLLYWVCIIAPITSLTVADVCSSICFGCQDALGTPEATCAAEASDLSEKLVGQWRPTKAAADQIQTIHPDGTGTNVDGSRFTWHFEGRHLVARRVGDSEDTEAILSIRFTRDANTYQLTLEHGNLRVEFQRLGGDGKPVGHKEAAGGEYADGPVIVPPFESVRRRKAIGQMVVHVDTKAAPELRTWAIDVAAQMERWYPKVVEALGFPETKPVLELQLVLKGGDRPDGETKGKTIILSSKWITEHTEQKSIAAHEMVHVLQRYGTAAPAWLVEGIPDYIRYFVIDPGTAPRFEPQTADYTNGYVPTATMLDWAERTKGPGVVARLNLSLREGTYSDDVFEKLVGCKPQEAWRRFLTSYAPHGEAEQAK